MLLAEKNVINGVTTGMGAGEMVAFECPVPIARILVDHLESEGSLLTQSDIAGAAIMDRAIGNRGAAYMGTAYGYARIDGTTSLPSTPGGSAHFDSYVVPFAGPLQATILPSEIDEAMFGQGNTGGAYQYRRTVITKWGAVVLDPKHIIRVRATAG